MVVALVIGKVPALEQEVPVLVLAATYHVVVQIKGLERL